MTHHDDRPVGVVIDSTVDIHVALDDGGSWETGSDGIRPRSASPYPGQRRASWSVWVLECVVCATVWVRRVAVGRG